MKIKFLTILMILSAIFASGCYDDSNNATVRINLGNMPIAKNVQKKSLIDRVLCFFSKEAYAAHPSELIKLHLVAFQGSSRIALRTINISSVTEDPQNPYNEYVIFEVPAGDNITIVILGESEIQDISFYGKSVGPINLQSGGVETVSIQMDSIENAVGVYGISSSVHTIRWQNLSGVSNYYLEIQDQIDPYVYYSLWEGIGTSYINAQTAIPYYRMRIDFGFINRSSSYIEFVALAI